MIKASLVDHIGSIHIRAKNFKDFKQMLDVIKLDRFYKIEINSFLRKGSDLHLNLLTIPQIKFINL